MQIDRKVFYDKCKSYFEPKLNQKQVDSYNAILDFWEFGDVGYNLTGGDGDANKLAYILATAYHETGARMYPVREGYAKTDAEAIRIVTGMYEKGRITKNYALMKANGKSYYGRGFVQLTWDLNYKVVGKTLGWGMKLYNEPDIALNVREGAIILVIGMMQGLFTGKKLGYYINKGRADFVNARKIVNGLDRAKDIAAYAEKYRRCLIYK